MSVIVLVLTFAMMGTVKKRRIRKLKLLPPYKRVALAAALTAGIVFVIVSVPSWKLPGAPVSAKDDDRLQTTPSESPEPTKIEADTTSKKSQDLSAYIRNTYESSSDEPVAQAVQSTGSASAEQQKTLSADDCPAPNFMLTVARQSGSNNDLYIVATPVVDDPGSRDGCGGVDFDTPLTIHPTNGLFCDALLTPMASNAWKMACNTYGGTPAGAYTFTFHVTGTNGYGLSTSRSKSLTYNHS